MRKSYRHSAIAALALSAALSAGHVQASQTLTIPYAAALPRSEGTENCINDQPFDYSTTTDECYLVFPIEIATGHTIHQISVFHTTTNFNPGQGFIQAWLDVLTLTPAQPMSEQQRFLWTAF